MHFDLSIFTFLNDFAGQSALADRIGVFLAEYSQYILGLILLILLFYPKSKRIINRPMVVMSLVAAVVARFGVKTAILFAYGRPRPYVVMHTAHKLLSTSISENYKSFPSGHTIFFFALATVLYLFNKKLGAWFYIAATVMAIARVFVGVHWPTDIIGGAILGIIVGWVTMFVYELRKNKIDRAIHKFFHRIDNLLHVN